MYKISGLLGCNCEKNNDLQKFFIITNSIVINAAYEVVKEYQFLIGGYLYWIYW